MGEPKDPAPPWGETLTPEEIADYRRVIHRIAGDMMVDMFRQHIDQAHNPATEGKHDEWLIDRVTDRVEREWPSKVTCEWSDDDMMNMGIDPERLRAEIKRTLGQGVRTSGEIFLTLRTPWQSHHTILWRAPVKPSRVRQRQPLEERAERPVWVKP